MKRFTVNDTHEKSNTTDQECADCGLFFPAMLKSTETGGAIEYPVGISNEAEMAELLWNKGGSWAQVEFGSAELGDARRTWRLVDLAQRLGLRPDSSLPEATGDWAGLKAAYRFFDNKQINNANILLSHVQATYDRIRHFPVVLCVQDTTILDFTTHEQTTGLGPLSCASHQGLMVHTMLAITPERVPLGLLFQKVWARDPITYADLVDRKKRAIEDKESIKWPEGLDAMTPAQKACPHTHLVCVGDRESDIYDLFIRPRPVGVDILVRASWDRATAEPEKYLWKAMATADICATAKLRVPRRKGAAAHHKKPARPDQPDRVATLEIRYKYITLRPPRKRKSEHLPNVGVWVVWAVEVMGEDREAGIDPIEWMLITTVPVNNGEDAVERLEWYSCRWGIEVWHKVLKSGCRIEVKQLETAERLKRCLSVYSVIAWRILLGTMLARIEPDIACTAILEENEWKALYCKIHRSGELPEKPPTLHTAIRWIATLGGFLGRKGDGEPGVTVLWRGFQHLADLTEMYQIMRPRPPR